MASTKTPEELHPETVALLDGHTVNLGDRKAVSEAPAGKRPLYRYLVLLNGDTIGHITAVWGSERAPVRRGTGWTIDNVPVLKWLPVVESGMALDNAVKPTRTLAAQTLAGYVLRRRADPTITDPSF